MRKNIDNVVSNLQPLADKLDNPSFNLSPQNPIKTHHATNSCGTAPHKDLPQSRLNPSSSKNRFPHEIFSTNMSQNRRCSAGYLDNGIYPNKLKLPMKRVTSIPDLSGITNFKGSQNIEPLCPHIMEPTSFQDIVSLKRDCVKIMQDESNNLQKMPNYMSFLPTIKRPEVSAPSTRIQTKHATSNSASPSKIRHLPLETELIVNPNIRLPASSPFTYGSATQVTSPQSMPLNFKKTRMPNTPLGNFAEEFNKVTDAATIHCSSQIANLELLTQQIQRTGSNITFNVNQNFYFTKPCTHSTQETSEESPRMAIKLKPVIRKSFSSQVKSSSMRSNSKRIPKVFLEMPVADTCNYSSVRTIDPSETCSADAEMRKTAYFKSKANSQNMENEPKKIIKLFGNVPNKKNKFNFLNRLEESMRKKAEFVSSVSKNEDNSEKSINVTFGQEND